jgi:hypothetical protein
VGGIFSLEKKRLRVSKCRRKRTRKSSNAELVKACLLRSADRIWSLDGVPKGNRGWYSYMGKWCEPGDVQELYIVVAYATEVL